MSELSELRQRVVVLEAVAKRQAEQLEAMSRLMLNLTKVVNDNADLCTRNFRLLCEANNSVVQAINRPVEGDEWKHGGGDDATSDPEFPAAG